MRHSDTGHPGSLALHTFSSYLTARTYQQALTMVRDHKKWMTDPSSRAHSCYMPLRRGLIRALNSTDPRQTLQDVVDRVATRPRPAWMGPVYAQMADNFHQLRPTGGTGVPTHQAEWVIDGLTLVAKDLLGIRTPQGGLLLVLPHMNKEELDREAADLLLGVLSEVVDLVLPGATPEVWDMRRGKRFRLRGNANRTTLRVALQGYIAKYQREWALIA